MKKGKKTNDYNRDFFTEMYVSLYTPLVAYLLQYTNSLPEAEDLAQTSFAKIWDRRKELNIKSSFKSYLFSIGYNLFIDTYRSQQKHILMVEQLKKDSLDAIIHENIDNDIAPQLKQLENAINELPAKCQKIFILHKKKGLPYRTIADQLGISLKTVESQMRIAMIKIRAHFKDFNMLLLMTLMYF